MKKRTRRLSSLLKALPLVGVAAVPVAAHGQVFLNTFNNAGSGNISGPFGVAVNNSSGNVYVTDASNNRVDIFNSAGAFQSSFGSGGSGNGQFQTPRELAVDSSGNIYVADTGNDRIEVFDSNGVFESTFGTPGSGNGQFSLPAGVAVSSNGTIYTSEEANDRVQIFNSSEVFQSTFGSFGSSHGQLINPVGMAVASNGDLYVADQNNNRVEIFNSTGTFQSSFGSSGSGNGQFNSPESIAIGSSGDVFVTDNLNSRVDVFNSSGVFQSSFGSGGSGDGQYQTPIGVAMGSNGMLYVTDYNNNRVQRYFSLADWSSGTNTFTDGTAGPTTVQVSSLGSPLLGSNFTLNASMGLNALGIQIGDGGTFTQSGGSVTTNNLTVAGNTVPATYNYNGGAFNVGTVTVGSGGTFNITGNTLPGSPSDVTISVTPIASVTSSAASVTLNTGNYLTFTGGGTVTLPQLSVNNGALILEQALLNETGSIINSGEILLTDPTASVLTISTSGQNLQNNGQIDGSGQINAFVINSGTISAGSGNELQFSQSLINQSSGLIIGTAASLVLSFGIANSGNISWTGTGNNFGDFSGSIVNNSGGTVAFSNFVDYSGTITNASGATLITSQLTTMNGTVINNSGGSVVCLGGRSFFIGSVTNNGTISIPSTAVAFFQGGIFGAGTFTNNGSLEFTGALAEHPGQITGNGALFVGDSRASTLVQLNPNSGGSTVSSLSISPGSTLDLTNNHLFINYAGSFDPIASIEFWLASGYNAGAWNGAGIISSTAATTPGYGLGYADAADAGNPAALASGTIEIKYTLLGDANLDGLVNGIDFGILAANFNKGVTGWDKGDFNYDNVVSGIDFGELAANFNRGATGASIGPGPLSDPALVAFAEANGLMADVPEPVSIGMIAVGSFAGMARRRKRTEAAV